MNPAGGGLDARAEFIAESVVNEEVKVSRGEVLKLLLSTADGIEDIAHRVHNTYHAKGVAKPPWRQCHRTVCRQAKELVDQIRKEDKDG